MDDKEFKQKFLDSVDNFDNILIQNNNPLVNSQEYYLNYKQTYIATTLENLKTYSLLKNQLDKLLSEQHQVIDGKKVYYTYIDNQLLDNLREQCFQVYTKQKQLLENFTHQVNFVNLNFKKLTQQSNDTVVKTKTRRSLLSNILYKRNTN